MGTNGLHSNVICACILLCVLRSNVVIIMGACVHAYVCVQQSNDEFLREMDLQQVCVSGVEWVGVCGQCGICVCVFGGKWLYLEHCTFCHSPVSEELAVYMQC